MPSAAKRRLCWHAQLRRPGCSCPTLVPKGIGTPLTRSIAAIRHALCLPDTPISAATRFTEDLGLDSLDLVEVAMELEARFQVELPDDFGQRCRSVAEIAGYLSQRYFQDAPDAELECKPADFALAA